MIRLHGASSARVPSGHTPCARHHVQAGQLYLRELRGLEAFARAIGDRSIAIDSHLVAVQTPSGSSWWSLLVDFGVPKYCLYNGRGRLWLNSLKDTAFSRGLFLCFPVFVFRAMAFGLARLGLLSAMSVA